MKLVVLGSGTLLAHAGRNPAGFALHTAKQWLVFDLGSGNLKQLAHLGLYPPTLDHIFFSHFHLDHIGDLPSLLFGSKIPGNRRARPLHLYGPRGLKALYEGMSQAWGTWVGADGYELILHELAPGVCVEGEGYRVLAFHAEHGGPETEALCYRVEEEHSGKVFAYSGDSDDCQGLRECCDSADLAVLECATTDKQKLPGHLAPKWCGNIARDCAIKQTVLTHLYNDCYPALVQLANEHVPFPSAPRKSFAFEPDPQIKRSFREQAGYDPIFGYDLMEWVF